MSFHDLEAAIIARLQDKLGSLVKHVYGADEFATVDEESQFTPSAAVIYTGYTPTQTAGPALKVQEIEQTWLVVVACRNAYHTRTKRGAREDSAPICKAVIEALIGWRPPIDAETPLRLAGAPEPQFSDAGLAYYPIAFTNRRTFRGTD